jgi:hypothetical protein
MTILSEVQPQEPALSRIREDTAAEPIRLGLHKELVESCACGARHETGGRGSTYGFVSPHFLPWGWPVVLEISFAT